MLLRGSVECRVAWQAANAQERVVATAFGCLCPAIASQDAQAECETCIKLCESACMCVRQVHAPMDGP